MRNEEKLLATAAKRHGFPTSHSRRTLGAIKVIIQKRFKVYDFSRLDEVLCNIVIMKLFFILLIFLFVSCSHEEGELDENISKPLNETDFIYGVAACRNFKFDTLKRNLNVDTVRILYEREKNGGFGWLSSRLYLMKGSRDVDFYPDSDLKRKLDSLEIMRNKIKEKISTMPKGKERQKAFKEYITAKRAKLKLENNAVHFSLEDALEMENGEYFDTVQYPKIVFNEKHTFSELIWGFRNVSSYFHWIKSVYVQTEDSDEMREICPEPALWYYPGEMIYISVGTDSLWMKVSHQAKGFSISNMSLVNDWIKKQILAKDLKKPDLVHTPKDMRQGMFLSINHALGYDKDCSFKTMGAPDIKNFITVLDSLRLPLPFYYDIDHSVSGSMDWNDRIDWIYPVDSSKKKIKQNNGNLFEEVTVFPQKIIDTRCYKD